MLVAGLGGAGHATLRVASGCLLVDLVLAAVTAVFGEAGRSDLGAAEEDAEVLVQVGQESAERVSASVRSGGG